MAKQKIDTHLWAHHPSPHPHPLAFLRCRGALWGSKRLQHSSEWWWRPPYAPRFSKMELRRNGWQVQLPWIPAAQTALQDRQDRPAPMLDVTPTPARGRMCAIILTPANADASVSNPQHPGHAPRIEVAPTPTRGGSMRNRSPPCRCRCHLDVPTSKDPRSSKLW